MASIDTATVHTAVELAKRTNNQQQLEIAMVLAEENEFFSTAKWKMANRIDADRITRQMSVPSPGTRGYNEGYAPTVMQTGQIDEPICLVEDRSEIDEAIVEDAPNPRQYRYEEDLGHMEGMVQKAVDLFISGDLSSDPQGINGLNQRFDALADANVHTNGDASAGAVTSAYLVQWGSKYVYLTYPMNWANRLVKMIDEGKQWVITSTTTNSGLMKYMTRFKLKMGLSIKDNTSVQRICNIGTSAANNLDLELVIKGRNLMPRRGRGSVLYVNITTQTQLDILALTQNNIVYSKEDNFGSPVTMVQAIPVHMLEGITDTQAVVA